MEGGGGDRLPVRQTLERKKNIRNDFLREDNVILKIGRIPNGQYSLIFTCSKGERVSFSVCIMPAHSHGEHQVDLSINLHLVQPLYRGEVVVRGGSAVAGVEFAVVGFPCWVVPLHPPHQ